MSPRRTYKDALSARACRPFFIEPTRKLPGHLVLDSALLPVRTVREEGR